MPYEQKMTRRLRRMLKEAGAREALRQRAEKAQASGREVASLPPWDQALMTGIETTLSLWSQACISGFKCMAPSNDG